MTGSGTLLDPYVIWDANDLQDMSLDLAAYYELGQDIDASATAGWNGGAGFVPIGTWGVSFTGHFDGNGYTITGLTINRPATDEIGLLGCARGINKVVQNVTLTNVSIVGADDVAALTGAAIETTIRNCSSSGTVTGDDIVGGLVGWSEAELVSGCNSSCIVTGNAMVGGLVGYISAEPCGSIYEECFATGDVTAAPGFSSDAGGFVGETGAALAGSAAVIRRCFATGNVVAEDFGGGFVGYHGYNAREYLDIVDCYARGNVVVTDPVWAMGGGFCGQVIGDRPLPGTIRGGRFYNCYSTGSVAGIGDIGGFLGEASWAGVDAHTAENCFWDTETSGILTSDLGTGKTTAQMKSSSTFPGWDFIAPWCLSEIDTLAAADVGGSRATLHGELVIEVGNDLYPFLRYESRTPCEVCFEYGTNPSSLGSTPWQAGISAGVSFNTLITNLGSTYYFRAVARNAGGTIYGPMMHFTTAAGPKVTTRAATEIREVTARINGYLENDAGEACICWFELGTTTAYGVETPKQPNLTSGTAFDQDISGLAPGSAFHFRALALNRYGLAVGADAVFSTKAPLGPVTLIPDDLALLMQREE